MTFLKSIKMLPFLKSIGLINFLSCLCFCLVYACLNCKLSMVFVSSTNQKLESLVCFTFANGFIGLHFFIVAVIGHS